MIAGPLQEDCSADLEADYDAEEEAAWAEYRSVRDDPFEPPVVTRAFLREPVVVGPWTLAPLTMRGWLELSRGRSWLLDQGSARPADGEWTLRTLALGLSVLSRIPVTIEVLAAWLAAEVGEDAAAIDQVTEDLFGVVARLVSLRHETLLDLKAPGTPKLQRRDGFGAWLWLYRFGLIECRMAPETVMETGVAEIWALLAITRYREGYEVQGEDYRTREVGSCEATKTRREEE